jgi:tetratricopeptide (TPR) repeat protein
MILSGDVARTVQPRHRRGPHLKSDLCLCFGRSWNQTAPVRMSGQIFISYRREEASAWARLVKTGLFQHFPKSEIFMDVDTIEPGMDFVAAIEESVGSCEVLIAVIGKRWLDSSDGEGGRRIDNPEDSVRLEIATALKRNVRVIPVLVDGASMPRSSNLPDDLKLLARRNALEVSHNRFSADFDQLVAVLERVLEKADAERKQREETVTPKATPKSEADAERNQRVETVTSTPTAESESEAAIARGNTAYDKKDYDKAISEYNEAIRLNPNNARAYRERGRAYYRKKEYDKVLNDCTEAIHLDQCYAPAYNTRGTAYYEKKDHEKAISDYTKAIRLDPNYTFAYENRGLAYYRKKEYEKAISDYTDAIRLEPNFAFAYYDRGLAYYLKKDHEKAISDYTDAIRLDPNFAWAYHRRGMAYGEKNDYDKAISDYNEAILLDPRNASVYRNRGWAYKSQGKFGEAKADFAKADELEKAGQ